MLDFEGAVLSDYFLMKCISKGGVAEVYHARRLNEPQDEVVVKLFRTGDAQNETFRTHFMALADKITQFRHPSVLPWLEYGEGDGLLYIVQPFIASGTLADLLKRVGGRLPAMQALPILQQLCSAVQYAHNRSVIHGNMKPTNVLISTDGRILLADFSIARSTQDAQQSFTRVGWGSAEYAAPEQSLGMLRRESDVYALGALLFFILTGSPPFSGQSPVEVLLKHVREHPPLLRAMVPNISDAVDAVVQRALRKHPEERYLSVSEFSDAFFAAVNVAPIASPVARQVPTHRTRMITTSLAAAEAAASPAVHSQAGIQNSSESQPVGIPHTPVVSAPAAAVNTASSAPSPRTTRLLPPIANDEVVSVPQLEFTATDVTENYIKHAVQEDRPTQKSTPFWPLGPSEWSPIATETADDARAVPLTADAYLQQKSDVQGSAEAQPEQPEPRESVINEQNQSARTFNDHLKRWLPVIIIILLLLGLFGALGSAFFFPTP